MSGPILIMDREKQCIGAGPCIPRQLTEEERLKYASIKSEKRSPAYMLNEKFINTEVEEMKGIKISPPEKGKLVETLAEVQGKSNTLRHAAKIYFVSITTALKWVADYGIQFDDSGYVIREPEPKEEELAAHITEKETTNEVDKETKEYEENIQTAMELVEVLKPTDIITIIGQETKEISKRLGYVEHDVGDAILRINFRQELVKIATPNDGKMTFEEAIAAAELILDILDHE